MPYGPFGAKPAGASAFIAVSILMDTEALTGITMPARALTFNSIDTLMNAKAFACFAPKGPCGLLEACSE